MADATPVRPADGFVSTLPFFPLGTKFYQITLVDVPGVVLANNFISHFNPVASGKIATPVQLIVQSYSTGNVSTAGSMTTQRISAASGGTLIAAGTLNRPDPAQSDPVTVIRTGNPTVTLTGLPIAGIAPVQSSGGGTTSAGFISPPEGPSVMPQGTGFAFFTPAGSTMQMWNIKYTWGEY